MKILNNILAAILLLAASGSLAGTVGSSGDIQPPDPARRFDKADGNTILVIENTDSVIPTTLTNLGRTFDLTTEIAWETLDLTPYENVFVTMDGSYAGGPQFQSK